MTVKELINLLEKCPDLEECEVRLMDANTLSVYELYSVETSLATRSMFISFTDWYNRLIRNSI